MCLQQRNLEAVESQSSGSRLNSNPAAALSPLRLTDVPLHVFNEAWGGRARGK